MSELQNTPTSDGPPPVAMIPIQDWFDQCQARGPMSLRAHLNATDLADELAARQLRNRAVQALRLPKYRHLLGSTILADGSRSKTFDGMEREPDAVPAPVRPISVTIEPITEMVQRNQFPLPGTGHKLTALSKAISRMPRSKQEDVVKAVAALDDNRIFERAEKVHAQQRADDLARQVEEARRDKAFLQAMLMEGKGSSGKNVTRN